MRAARSWLLVRDFRAATRFTRPGVDATTALDALAAGELERAAAVTQIRKDLLDAYQARLGDYLDEAEQELDRGFGPAAAESAALVRGYWLILASEYEEQRGAAARRGDRPGLRGAGAGRAGGRQARVHPGARRRDRGPRRLHRGAVHARGGGAPGGAADPLPRPGPDRVRRRHRGRAGHDPVRAAGGRRVRRRRHRRARTTSRARWTRSIPARSTRSTPCSPSSAATRADAHEGGEVAPLEDVEAAHAEASEILDRIFPEEWKESTDEADFDLIEISLDQMEAAVSASRARTGGAGAAERLRVLRVRPGDQAPGVRPRPGHRGRGPDVVRRPRRRRPRRADRRRPPVSEIRETRLVLDEALDEAARRRARARARRR